MADVIVFVESNTTGTGRLFAERARELGVTPHMVSADSARYAYVAELGIPVHVCDTTSVEAVTAICGQLAAEHRIVGVTTSSEYFVDVVARVARTLGLPGEDPEVLTAARDKSVQRESFAVHAVASPAHRPVKSALEAAEAAEAIGLPVVVKPISASGSVGVRRCDTVREAAEHATALLSRATDERGRRLPAVVLVEEYLSGEEYSVEVLDGEIRMVTAKHVDETLGFLETGHDLPARVDPGVEEALRHSALAALAALGLSWGAAHVELRVARGRAHVIEVNPRLAGGMIPVAVLAATGQDLIAELIGLVAGLKLPSYRPASQYASIRFVVPEHDGVVDGGGGGGPRRARRTHEGVVAAAVTARPGQVVARQGSYLDRLGYVVAVGPDPALSRVRAGRAVEALRVGVLPIPKET